MNEFFRANAGTGPGQVWYEVYFDCTGYDNGGGENFLIYYPKDSSKVKVNQSAEMYRSLKWGDGGVSSVTEAPGITAVQPTDITPTYYCGGNDSCYPSENPNSSTTIVPPQADSNPNPSLRNNNGGNSNRGSLFSLIQRLIELILDYFRNLGGR